MRHAAMRLLLAALLLRVTAAEQCRQQPRPPLPRFQRRMVEIEGDKRHLPQPYGRTNDQRPRPRRSLLIEQNLPTNILYTRDQRPIALKQRIVNRQFALREILESDAVAQRLDLLELARHNCRPGTT